MGTVGQSGILHSQWFWLEQSGFYFHRLPKDKLWNSREVLISTDTKESLNNFRKHDTYLMWNCNDPDNINPLVYFHPTTRTHSRNNHLRGNEPRPFLERDNIRIWTFSKKNCIYICISITITTISVSLKNVLTVNNSIKVVDVYKHFYTTNSLRLSHDQLAKIIPCVTTAFPCARKAQHLLIAC